MSVEQVVQAEPVAQPDLLDAVEAYLEAQGALDNRELMGPNAEPHEVLNRRRRDAYAALDDAIIAAKKRAAQPVAPAGWRLVPEDPTEAMMKAAVVFANGNAVYKNVAAGALKIEESIYGEAYAAMLAAAPTREVPRHE